MRFGVYSQWYDPEPGPASLPGVYARALAERGHDVSVLTGFPNYPSGHLYPGYTGRRPLSETLDDIDVHRVPLYPNHGRSGLGRLANYASFAATASALGGRDINDVDALWVYNSPATVAIPLLMRKRKRAPFLLHIQDLWPQSVIESGMFPAGRLGAVAIGAIRALVRHTEAAASAIAVISPSVKELLVRNGMAPDKIAHVPNPTNESLFYPRVRRPEIRSPLAAPEDFLLMYAGSLGFVQGLDVALDAMSLLRDRSQIKLLLVGTGVNESALRAQAERLGLRNVGFHGQAPQSQIPDLMAAADVQLVSLRDDAFLALTTPSKLPAIMASGLPILASMRGDGAALVTRSGGGHSCCPGDPAALASAIRLLADLPASRRQAIGQSGRRHYLRHMSAGKTAQDVERLLTRIASE